MLTKTVSKICIILLTIVTVIAIAKIAGDNKGVLHLEVSEDYVFSASSKAYPEIKKIIQDEILEELGIETQQIEFFVDTELNPDCKFNLTVYCRDQYDRTFKVFCTDRFISNKLKKRITDR